MNQLINRLNQLIEALNLTKHSLANISGIAPSNFSKMLNGEQTITDKTLRKIAEAFPQVSYVWLRSGEGDIFTDDQNIRAIHPSSSPTISELLNIIRSQQETILELTRRLPKQ